MQIEVIDNHSVAIDLLRQNGWALDAGSRGFAFSNDMALRGLLVLAYDPDKSLPRDVGDRIYTGVGAVVAKRGFYQYCNRGDPGAGFVGAEVSGPGQGQDTICLGSTMFDLMNRPDLDRVISEWEIVKLNIEGSEYDILDTWPGPIARQVVVSFHEHTPRARGRAECDRLIAKMSEWYKAFNVVWEKRYCCAENYWDLLFIRNDLV